MKKINIPVGISDFKEIRKNGYYYVDKTFLIKELLKTTATKVTLITRPRRFGKTMAMSMLADYFDIRENSQDLFEGLEISKETAKLTDKKWMPTLVWILCIVAIWEIMACVVATTKRTPENILPHIYQILYSLISTKKVTGTQTALQVVALASVQTLLRAAVGFLIGMAAGFGLALLMKLSGIVEKLAFPYLMLIQLIPILGMAPIILSLTGSIGVSRIVIAAILTFYPVAANTLAGLKSVQQEKYELMYSYAANRRTIYKKVLIPSCIPYFFTGLKIAAPMAITASILVDTLQGDGGLGCMLSQSLKHAMSIYVFWDIVLVSAVIGVLSAKIMGWLELAISPLKRIDRKIKGKGNGK